MRIFVSYSFKDSELYLLALLFDKLRSEGHEVESSGMYYLEHDDNPLFNPGRITRSDLFIGLITNDSEAINEVELEWEVAVEHRVQRLLLVEDGVTLEDEGAHIVRFNRNDPDEAIDQLFKEKSQAKEDNSSSMPLIVLAVVAIAAVVMLLSGIGKKR